MICPQCNTPTHAGAKLCTRCGQRLTSADADAQNGRRAVAVDAGDPRPGPTRADDGWIVYTHPDDLFSLRHPPSWVRSTNQEFGACLRLDFQINKYTYLDVFARRLAPGTEDPADCAAQAFMNSLNQAIAKEGREAFRVEGPFEMPRAGRTWRRVMLDHLVPVVLSGGDAVGTTVELFFVSAGAMTVVVVFEAATERWEQFQAEREAVLENVQLPERAPASAGEPASKLPETSADELGEVLTKRAMYFYHLAAFMGAAGSALGLLKGLAQKIGQMDTADDSQRISEECQAANPLRIGDLVEPYRHFGTKGFEPVADSMKGTKWSIERITDKQVTLKLVEGRYQPFADEPPKPPGSLVQFDASYL